MTEVTADSLMDEQIAAHDKTEKMAEALESAARAYSNHSGPESTNDERGVFRRDLRSAALRYARAYYDEARELGLIPEYERAAAINARSVATKPHRSARK